VGGGYQLSAVGLTGLLQAAGFRQMSVETVELDADWHTREEATATFFGTPFGPLVSELDAVAQQQLRERLAAKLGASADGLTVRTVSNVVSGIKS
jgi:hypothetical protein